MANSSPGQGTFGREASRLCTAAELLDLECTHGKDAAFESLDLLVGTLALRSLRGETPFTVVTKEGRDAATSTTLPPWRAVPGSRMSIEGLSPAERELVVERFSLEHQQARGSWWVPELPGAATGMLHFPHHLRRHGRFFHDAVGEDRTRFDEGSAEGLLAHTLMQPLMSGLYEPFALRSGRAFASNETNSPEDRLKGRQRRMDRWYAAASFLSELGLAVEPELAVMQPGGGWSRLRAADQLTAKIALTEGMLRDAEGLGAKTLGARYRAMRTRALLEGYYAKANKAGQAVRRRALTRQLEGTLSGFFGGDWRKLLGYLGEGSHPDEHIATALPETKLYIETLQSAPSQTVGEGISEEQLKLIAASVYGSETSPVQRRLAVLDRYWQAFDELHAQQDSGMESLWGLVDGPGGFTPDRDEATDSPYRARLYERKLDGKLLAEIEELWGVSVLAKEPAALVTEPFPHARLAETFGPALRFWHGCALTAWFLCEGPYSRTDIAGLEHYHRNDLAELKELGAPVDRDLFAELIAAEKRLGSEQPIKRDVRNIEVEPGLSMEISMSSGSRRDGFALLRDIITEHRRAWADRYLKTYLRTRAEGDIRSTAHAYYKKTAERGGKPPTPKQFARNAVQTANRWFGGDFAAFFRAFGEPSPVAPGHDRLLPENIEAFAERVYRGLGGKQIGERPADYTRDIQEQYDESRKGMFQRAQLANMAVDYVRLQEALGRAPTLNEVGKGRFERLASESNLSAGNGDPWSYFEEIVWQSLESSKEQTISSSVVTLPGTPTEDEQQPTQEAERSVKSAPPERTYEEQQAHEWSTSLRKPWWRRWLGK